MPSYRTSRQFASRRRQYETGDPVLLADLDADEVQAAVTSGAVIPVRFVDTAAALAAANPTPGAGVVCYATDTYVEKIGDGVTAYNSLPNAQSGTYASISGLALRVRQAAASAASAPVVPSVHPAPPTITTATSAIDSGLSKQYKLNTVPTAFKFLGGIDLLVSADFRSAYTLTSGFATGNVQNDSGKYGYLWAFDFYSDAPRVQINYVGQTNTYQVEVDGQVVSAANLARPSVGGYCWSLLDWTVGSATIVASTGVFTTAAAHGLKVGDPITLNGITTTTGISANNTYYVRTVPSSTTFTISYTFGGAAASLTGDGSVSSVSLAKTRRYRVWSYASSGVVDVKVNPLYNVWRPGPNPGAVRLISVGDSIDAETGNTLTGPYSWQWTAARMLGFDDVRACSLGGTGFLADNAGAGNTFGSAGRLNDVESHHVAGQSIIALGLTQNDQTFAGSTLQAAVLSTLQAYRTRFPTTPIILTGVSASSSGPSAGRVLVETDGLAAFTAWADGQSWFIPQTPSTTVSWENGTGTTAAPTGTGNRDRFGSDAAHPNSAGHLYIGSRWAAAFRELVLPTLR